MSNFTRKNAWNNQGTFDNPDLLWYAKAVGVMQSLHLNEEVSWWFYAAIHGEYVTPESVTGSYPDWADVPGPPNVSTSPLPAQNLIDQYWDQCQHAGWFFPPWHRGYLYAIENILRAIIVNRLKGPSDWALPYWNYFGPGNEYQIPPAFTQEYLPDNTTPNPLFVTARYGPNGDGNIFIPIPPVSQKCQQDTVYTNSYGGGETGFAHFAHKTGDLESNPHNQVHNYVGGNSNSSNYYGLMSDPGLAGLDPIFYLHHSNIDRMWAAWNQAGNLNPTDPNWLNGPTASGDRQFYMPNPDGTPWHYTPAMVNSISQLNYTYDDLSLGTAPALVSNLKARLRNLGVNQDDIKNVKSMNNNGQPELVGANNGTLSLKASGARTTVKLDSAAKLNIVKSLKMAAETGLPDEVYLQLEGVKGTTDSNIYTVSLNHQYVDHISLFGLRKASKKDSKHAGAGLTIRLNITHIIDQLHLNNELESNTLDVLIQPSGSVFKGGECTVDKVSIYRVAQS